MDARNELRQFIMEAYFDKNNTDKEKARIKKRLAGIRDTTIGAGAATLGVMDKMHTKDSLKNLPLSRKAKAAVWGLSTIPIGAGALLASRGVRDIKNSKKSK